MSDRQTQGAELFSDITIKKKKLLKAAAVGFITGEQSTR